jgi:YebC/PmpR family DNA-binding regulatory protein
MSGHSKWSTIKRAKGKTDAARGAMFTKLIKEITTAAKIGGGDPIGNARLRLAIEKAQEGNMPKDNMKRAIEKATGGGEGSQLEELTYEGYGPAGVAVLVECITDNKLRTLGEMRFIFSRNGGNLGENGCVGWMFKKKGVINFERGKLNEEKLMSDAIDAGAEDIATEESIITVTTTPETFEAVRDALKKQGFISATAEISMVPSNFIKVEGDDVHKVIKLVDALEENEDRQKVHANFDISDADLAKA